MVRYVQPPSVRTTSGAQMRSGKSFTLREMVVLSVLAGVLIVLTIVSLGTGGIRHVSRKSSSNSH